MLSNEKLKQIISDSLCFIWENEISSDYSNKWLLKEDTLKNALYYHIRHHLGALFAENNVRIYTEFTDWSFQRNGFRPDMVIARIDPEKEVDYWGNAVIDCLAVIEIKYKSGFSANEKIYADYEKLKFYTETLKLTSKLFMATIWECEDDRVPWLEDTPTWAKEKVIELNASFVRDSDYEPQFYVKIH